MEFLRSEDHRVLPWKNGGGVTREIAVHADSTVHPDFLWRVSIATVDRTGPFSRFEGIDRTIALLAGKGMVLESPERRTVLSPGCQPFSFDGETPIDASLVDGATTDLNAMTRRGYFSHSVERLLFSQPVTIDGESDDTVVVLNGDLTVITETAQYSGHPLDAMLHIEKKERIRLLPQGEAEIFVIRFSKPEDL